MTYNLSVGCRIPNKTVRKRLQVSTGRVTVPNSTRYELEAFCVSEEIEMLKSVKLVFGVGRNDAEYKITSVFNGRQLMCPFYRAWVNMLQRCYSSELHARKPAYFGCSVASEWLGFMSFREWMKGQKWEGMELDKDLLVLGNKFYSPDTCVFVTRQLNTFTIGCLVSRGDYPVGVYWDKSRGKYKAMCVNPFTGRREGLGRFTCPDAAHEAWRKRKHEHALRLAAEQTDPRIAKALSTRYLKEGDSL